jgi:hypothetical protein
MATFDLLRQAETEKSNGRYRFAGQLQALSGTPCYYGCHYGMKSTRLAAMEQFHAGWHEVEMLFTARS